MLPNPTHSITSIAKLLGVSPGTLYNHIPDLRELRAAATSSDETSDLRPTRGRITGPAAAQEQS